MYEYFHSTPKYLQFILHGQRVYIARRRSVVKNNRLPSLVARVRHLKTFLPPIQLSSHSGFFLRRSVLCQPEHSVSSLASRARGVW
jgi:hypothetical protein